MTVSDVINDRNAYIRPCRNPCDVKTTSVYAESCYGNSIASRVLRFYYCYVFLESVNISKKTGEEEDEKKKVSPPSCDVEREMA